MNYKPFFTTSLGTLFKGDCLSVMDYLIENNYVFDAIITDPPYASTQFSWDKVISFPEMWERLLKLIKPTGAIVLFGNEPFSSALRESNRKLYRYDWKWIKKQVTGFQNAKYQPLRCYEDIMIFSPSGAVSSATNHMCYYPQFLIPCNIKVMCKTIDYLKENKENKKKLLLKKYCNYPRNIIQIARESVLFHPTQKPIELMEYLVCTYTKENELVLDFTAGSGSTLLACERANRRWIGIELAEGYCDIIKKRIESGIQLKFQFEKKEEKI